MNVTGTMKPITNLNELGEYLDGLFYGRPGDPHPRYDHADPVHRTALLVSNLIVARKDRDTPIYVHTRKGNMTNTAYFTIDGRDYCITYDHTDLVIKRGNFSGPVVHRFNDTMDTKQIRDAFASLGSPRPARRVA
jgi:hypothetical protein